MVRFQNVLRRIVAGLYATSIFFHFDIFHFDIFYIEVKKYRSENIEVKNTEVKNIEVKKYRSHVFPAQNRLEI